MVTLASEMGGITWPVSPGSILIAVGAAGAVVFLLTAGVFVGFMYARAVLNRAASAAVGAAPERYAPHEPYKVTQADLDAYGQVADPADLYESEENDGPRAAIAREWWHKTPKRLARANAAFDRNAGPAGDDGA